MRAVDVFAAVALAAAPVLAMAQPAAAPPRHSAIHVKLARQLYALSGGETEVTQRIDAMFDAASKVIAASTPADQAKFVALMQTDTRDELVKLAPSLVEAGVRAYSDGLTTQELTDYIAQLSSAPAKPIVGTLPGVREEITALEPPRLARMIPGVQREVSYRVCAQMRCSTDQREMVASVMAQAFSRPKP